ncbi:hypothetical protein NPIL_100991 [Nephila pilipes]|uniref:Uncharacterized protein n=1 Tax=Nephila pilipes TaxID=299642 RepID=A0A8X6NDK7_NEPPI|nr:hypothetical protein NPIL_100991 [Nephila pilipes]
MKRELIARILEKPVSHCSPLLDSSFARGTPLGDYLVPKGCPSSSHSGLNPPGQPRGSLTTTSSLTFLYEMGPPALSLDRIMWKKCRALM